MTIPHDHRNLETDPPWMVQAVFDRLLGLALVSSAGMPDLSLGGLRHVPPGFQRWSTVLTSALTHRARLTAERVSCLAAPASELVPTLEEALNEPIVLDGK